MTSSTGFYCFFFQTQATIRFLLMFSFITDDDDMTDLAEAIMEDCDGEVSEKFFPAKDAWYQVLFV